MPTHLSKKDKTLEVRLVGEDIALADLLHYELLKDPSVIFAGVAPPHPLIQENTLVVQSRADPLDALVRSVKKASETVKEMLDKTGEALEGKVPNR